MLLFNEIFKSRIWGVTHSTMGLMYG